MAGALRHGLFAALFVLAAGLATAAWAQEAAQDEGPTTQEALEIAIRDKGPDHPDVGALLMDLAVEHFNQNDLVGAEAFLRRASEIFLASPPDDPSLAPRSFHNLAYVVAAQGRQAEAVELYLRAVALYRQNGLEDHRDLAGSLRFLADALRDLGRKSEAETHYAAALRILDPDPDASSQVINEIIGNLVALYRERQALDELEAFYRDLIASREEHFGEAHYLVVAIMTDLAHLLEERERFDEVEVLHREGLARYRQSLGEEHYTLGWKYLDLGRFYRRQGHEEEAARAFAQAEPYQAPFLANEEQRLGADSPAFAQVLIVRGRIYRYEIGDLDKARVHFNRALGILEAAYGPDDQRLLEILENLENLFEKQKDFASAVPVYARILGLKERELGPAHPGLMEALGNLAYGLNETGEHQAAERLIERALDITRTVKGPDSIEVGERYNELAVLAQRRGDFDLAEERFLESLTFFRRGGDANKNLVKRQLDSLILVAKQSGQADKAIGYALEYLAHVRRDQEPNLELFLTLLADGYQLTPVPANAEALLELFVEEQERDFDTQGLGRSLVLFTLGQEFKKRNDKVRARDLFTRALATYRETGDDDPTWIAPQLYELASMARQFGELEPAQERAEKAIALLAHDESLDLPTLLRSESLLGVIHSDLDDVESALAILARAEARLARLEEPLPLLAAQIRYNLATVQVRSGDPATGLATVDLALAAVEESAGIDHADYEFYLKYRGLVHNELGAFDKAEADIRQAIDLASRNGRLETPLGADMHVDLSTILGRAARFEETIEPLRRAVELREASLGGGHLKLAEDLILLGDAHRAMGRYDKALAPFRRALEIRKANAETTPELLVWALERVADTEGFLGDYELAETLYQRALSVWQDDKNHDGQWVSQTLRTYSNFKRFRADYAGGEELAKRALAFDQTRFGQSHPQLVPNLNHLVELYIEMGRSFDAAEHQLRAIAILETQDDIDALALAGGLTKLAFIKAAWREKEEAAQLLTRAEALLDEVDDQVRQDVGLAYLHLGDGYKRIESLDKAETTYRKSQEILDQTTNSANLNRSLVQLHQANIKIEKKEFDVALSMMESTLDDLKDTLGPDNPITSVILEMTPALYLLNGQPEKAVAMFDQTVQSEDGGPLKGHPLLAFVNAYRGLVEWDRGDLDTALASISKASDLELQSIRRAAQDRSESGRGRTYVSDIAVTLHIALLGRLAEERPDRRDQYIAEAFELAQARQKGSAAGALARMAARFSAGSDELATIVRDRQDRLEQWTQVSRNLASAASRPLDQRNLSGEAEMRDLLARLDEEMRGLDQRIERDFPDYAALVRPGAAPLEQIQSLLRPDEAMLFYSVEKKAESPALEEYLKDFVPGRTTLWVIRRDRLELLWIDLDEERLKEAISALRGTLDPTRLFNPSLDEIPPFAESLAHELYQEIFQPAEPFLEDVRNVFVVPTGSLQSLPLGVLITEPAEDPAKTLADHQRLNWLARAYAMTTLPSVSSLRSLRHFAKTARASEPFTGFGNPVLDGEPAETRGALNLAALFRGSLADVKAVRDLPALPDSEQELYDMAAALDAERDSVYLQAEATETRVKTMDLSDSRVLAFATHGLIAGELEDNVEPALVMTPPETGSVMDDGLLTASEIAQLKLNADWVILSACNTAAGSRPGAEGLSGLARAFFYAGSRALLVTHWLVASDAAVKLTTRMLESARHGNVTRAEALQESLLALMSDPEHPEYAHPMFWAPFTIVGEGGSLGG